jgi:hypothetical protein
MSDLMAKATTVPRGCEVGDTEARDSLMKGLVSMDIQV